MAERPTGPPTLAVLAKAPVPGYAKTRLVPRLGAHGAAALHGLLVARTAAAARASGFGGATLWCAPGAAHPFFQALAAEGRLALRDQPDGDLGARMRAAVEQHLSLGGPVLLVGTDCPALGPALLDEARAALLGGAEAVLLPAEDGGYAALGLSRGDPALFEGVAWGGPDVLRATLERLRAGGFTVASLDPVRDVDRPEDVDWLVASGLLAPPELEALAPLLEGGLVAHPHAGR